MYIQSLWGSTALGSMFWVPTVNQKPNTYHLTVMAVTCRRLCMETCFAHPMQPDDLRCRDPQLSSQPTENQPHGDPRPATRSLESHDPKEAGDQGANRQRQVTTQPEFRRGAKRQESRQLEVQRQRAESVSGRTAEIWRQLLQIFKTTCLLEGQPATQRPATQQPANRRPAT